jgi:hypothetical protein
MSLHETPMTRWYWRKVGGTLVEEFPAVPPGKGRGQRLIDGIIIRGGRRKIARADQVSLEGKDIIVIQTKAARLGMYLMGQAFFSARLMERFRPRSIVSVALVRESDSVLEPLFQEYPNMKVVVCPASRGLTSRSPRRAKARG